MNREPLVNLTYTEGKDGLMYPNLAISENEPTTEVGKYGKMWKDWMMENHPQRVTELVTTGKINKVTVRVDEKAEEHKEKLIQEILAKDPIAEAEDTLEREAHMRMIYRTAEELMMDELFKIK